MVLTFFTLFSFWHPVPVGAVSSSYITIVNPVRGSDLSGNAGNLSKQAEITASFALPVTWLLQYDVLSEQKYLEELNKYKANNEIGIFLEVSENWATAAGVSYKIADGDYYRPDKVFLSGYSIQDRRKLIKTYFKKYQEVFGTFPQVAGAWYIDARSQAFLAKLDNQLVEERKKGNIPPSLKPPSPSPSPESPGFFPSSFGRRRQPWMFDRFNSQIFCPR